MKTSTATRITGPITHHGEGPFWDMRAGRLLLVDLLAGAVVSIDAEGNLQRHPVPSTVACLVRRRRGGGFVIATERGLVFAEEDLQTFSPGPEFLLDEKTRLNEGGCDPHGRLFIGSMAYDGAEGHGSLFRITADRTEADVAVSKVSISNGLQWSADGTRAFYIDTPTRRVDVFDVDPNDGGWSNRRAFIEVDNTPGFPDGMAIDQADGLWVALWGGSAVHHYDAHGTLVEVIEVPGVSQVTACAFGGPAMTTLYITTSRAGLADDAEPMAGSVFAVETSQFGARLHEYAR